MNLTGWRVHVFCRHEVHEKLGGDTHTDSCWFSPLFYAETQPKLSFAWLPSETIIHLKFTWHGPLPRLGLEAGSLILWVPANLSANLAWIWGFDAKFGVFLQELHKILGYLGPQSEIPSDSPQTIWSKDRDLYGSHSRAVHSCQCSYILSGPP